MSGGLEVLSLKEDDVTKMLTACTHIGSDNVDYQMEQYVYKRRPDGKNMLIARHQQIIVNNSQKLHFFVTGKILTRS
jgi:ribosomal protein S2